MSKIITRKLGNRLRGYDYSQSNYYYVTICTDKRKEWFGEIENNQMLLNDYGQIVQQQWQWLEKQYSYTELSDFAWQRSFYDHIIRNESSLREIREYIRNNPATWNNDEENIK